MGLRDVLNNWLHANNQKYHYPPSADKRLSKVFNSESDMIAKAYELLLKDGFVNIEQLAATPKKTKVNNDHAQKNSPATSKSRSGHKRRHSKVNAPNNGE